MDETFRMVAVVLGVCFAGMAGICYAVRVLMAECRDLPTRPTTEERKNARIAHELKRKKP